MIWLLSLPALILAIGLFALPAFALGLVPAARESANRATFILWVLYGNDHGGLFGERDDNWVLNLGNTERTVWTAFRWWLRNPLHNLMWDVLRRESIEVLVVRELPPQGILPYRRPAKNWVNSGPQYQWVRDPFFFSWRGDSWEGYLGWRENGVLGAALRKFKKL